MKAIRSSFGIIGCIALFLFVLQYVAIQAESVGWIPCAEECEHSASHESTDSSEPLTHCSLHCSCHQLTFVPEADAQPFFLLVNESPLFLILNETAPDGPVFGIEYPPQMLA